MPALWRLSSLVIATVIVGERVCPSALSGNSIDRWDEVAAARVRGSWLVASAPMNHRHQQKSLTCKTLT